MNMYVWDYEYDYIVIMAADLDEARDIMVVEFGFSLEREPYQIIAGRGAVRLYS